MIILEANQFGEPVDTSYNELWTKSHKFYNAAINTIILFDDFFEYKEYMDKNYPEPPLPIFTWDVPSNAIVVDHTPNGLPVDDKWLFYPRFFRGDILFVFNTQQEFDQYIADRTDYQER